MIFFINLIQNYKHSSFIENVKKRIFKASKLLSYADKNERVR